MMGLSVKARIPKNNASAKNPGTGWIYSKIRRLTKGVEEFSNISCAQFLAIYQPVGCLTREENTDSQKDLWKNR